MIEESDDDIGDWYRRDADFAQARRGVVDAGTEWRAAGGYWDAQTRTHPELYAHVERAKQVRDELAANALPVDPTDLLRRVENGSPEAIETAVAWLEDDPFSWHSGYFKQKLMRRIRRASLTEAQADRLRVLLLRLCERGPREEFSDTRRLARRLTSDAFRDALRVLSASQNPRTRWAADKLLLSCTHAGPS